MKYKWIGTTYSGRFYVIKEIFYKQPKVIETLKNLKEWHLKNKVI